MFYVSILGNLWFLERTKKLHAQWSAFVGEEGRRFFYYPSLNFGAANNRV